MSTVATPKMNRFQIPHTQMVSGEQRYPALNPESLQVAVVSALTGLSGVTVEQSNSARPERIRVGERSGLFIKTFLTQLDRALGESESSLSSVSPLALLGTFSRKERVGIVRMDIQIVSLSDGRFVAAFPVVGEISDSDSSLSFLSNFDAYGESSKTQALISEAIKVSLKKLQMEISKTLVPWRAE